MVVLVTVDALSKWPEVWVVNSTSASQTIDKLRTTFAAHGLPVTLVSDNGASFSSKNFEDFMKANGIIHCRVPPYHLSSNRLAENMVKSLKQSLSKANKNDSIEIKIARFLASYRNTPRSITGRTPAEVLLGQSPRTRLSLIHPCMSQRMSVNIEKRVGDKSPGAFETGQAVLLRDLRPAVNNKWRPAVISRKLGPLAYEVNVDGQTRQAHVDHLKSNPQPPLAECENDKFPESKTDNFSSNDQSLTDDAMDDSTSLNLNSFLFMDNNYDSNVEQEHTEPVAEREHTNLVAEGA